MKTRKLNILNRHISLVAILFAFSITPSILHARDTCSTALKSALNNPSLYKKFEVLEPSLRDLIGIDPIKRQEWIDAHQDPNLRILAEFIANSIDLHDWKTFKNQIIEQYQSILNEIPEGERVFILFDKIDKSQAYLGALVNENSSRRVTMLSVLDESDELVGIHHPDRLSASDYLNGINIPRSEDIINSVQHGENMHFFYIDDGLYSGSQLSINLRDSGFSNLFEEVEKRGATADVNVVIHSYTQAGFKRVQDEMAGLDGKKIPAYDPNKIKIKYNFIFEMRPLITKIEEWIESLPTTKGEAIWETLLATFSKNGKSYHNLLLRKPLALMPHKLPDGMSIGTQITEGIILSDWTKAISEERVAIKFIPGNTLETFYRGFEWIKRLANYLNKQSI